jgi:uracil-DNA glycosylase
MKRVEIRPTFEDWQLAARALLRERVPPDQIMWLESGTPQDALPGLSPTPPAEDPGPTVRVPRLFMDLARRVAAGVDPDRWHVLYEALWRIVHERRDLLGDETDPLMTRLRGLERQASGAVLSSSAHADDDSRTTAAGAADFVPGGATLVELRQAALRCQGCDLYRHATQTVFGRGPADARVVLVGEQPGDQEDRQGAPFVGPAGEVFDRALAEAGLVRERIYVTNVVKHFKFVERGKRRIHQTPRAAEIGACRPWLEAELAVIRPEVVVCLGATAARALLGPDFRIMKERGRWIESRWAPRTMATLHPSAVLRGEDDAAQERLYGMLLEDLRAVARAIG